MEPMRSRAVLAAAEALGIVTSGLKAATEYDMIDSSYTAAP
jgi:hypothetical protein